MQHVEKIERDILEAVYDKGMVGFFDGSHSPAAQMLNAKYPAEQEQQAVMVIAQYLLEERYLFPFFDFDAGKESRNYVRGITPKGIDKLRQLRRPWLHWICANWFPFSVAVISATIGLTNIFVN